LLRALAPEDLDGNRSIAAIPRVLDVIDDVVEKSVHFLRGEVPRLECPPAGHPLIQPGDPLLVADTAHTDLLPEVGNLGTQPADLLVPPVHTAIPLGLNRHLVRSPFLAGMEVFSRTVHVTGRFTDQTWLGGPASTSPTSEHQRSVHPAGSGIPEGPGALSGSSAIRPGAAKLWLRDHVVVVDREFGTTNATLYRARVTAT
jgi:hypothetical protein